MNAKEVIRTLKSNAGVNNHAAIMLMAADLIESLQAQLDRETQSANRWILAANDYRKEKERIEETSKALESDIYNAEMNLEHITSQLTERDDRIKRLLRELTNLAIESVERMRELARLEAEVIAMQDATHWKTLRKGKEAQHE